MPSVRLTRDERENLLDKLRAGFDLESAGAVLGLSEAQLKLARGKYGPEMDQAFEVGTGKLKVKIMQHALDTVNPAVLLKLLELREKESEQVDPITLVERIIIQRCPNCSAQSAIGQPILIADDKEPPTETDDSLPPVDDMVEKGQKRSYMVPGGI